MFRIIYKKELLENVRNYRFLLALVICLVVIPLGFTVSQKDYADRRQVYGDTVRDDAELRKTVQDFLVNGGLAFRPPAALGLLSSGVEAVLPNAVETRGFVSQEGAQVQFNNSPRLDNPFTSLFGRLDLAFIVTTVLAVLVMIFAFNAVVGEKEKRTLAQVMANAVPRPVVIAAKMAAGGTLLAAAFLAGILAGVLLTTALGIDPFREPGAWAPFWIGVAASLVFLMAFYGFGLLVSSFSRSSISAMVVLLSCWVAMAMILPKASVVLAKLVRPIKSQQVVELEKSQVRRQSQRDVEDAVEKLAASTPGVKDMSFQDYAKAMKTKSPAIEAYAEAQAELRNQFTARLNTDLDKIDAAFDEQRAGQAAAARAIARLSPVSCLVHALAELAGTGFTEDAAWRETRFRYKQIIDRDIASKAQMTRFQNFSYGGVNIPRDAPAPKLPAEPVPLEKRLAAVWVDLALLGIYGILFFAGAYVAFLRYDVR
ncbi:MAG: ABC transporter permease subunit [Candidatus Aminicenantes bacterium]|nr:ABC transporter permease subunit [Candidatus Aminicenantes bacterium]